VALSRSTKRVVGGCFTLNPQFAFGHGGNHPGYVGSKDSRPLSIHSESFPALALSAKVSAEAAASYEKFCWIDPHRTAFSCQPFANFHYLKSMQQTAPICG